MPLLVICNKCGAILFKSIEELKAPDEIIQSYDGKCPTCGKKLSHIPKNVVVKPADETNQLSPSEPEKKGISRKKSRKKHKERLKKREYASYEPKLGSIWNKESV